GAAASAGVPPAIVTEVVTGGSAGFLGEGVSGAYSRRVAHGAPLRSDSVCPADNPLTSVKLGDWPAKGSMPRVRTSSDNAFHSFRTCFSRAGERRAVNLL